MQLPDLINGGFELLGGFFVLNHCRVLYKQKAVAGVSILSIVFFTSWGVWNIFFYKHLNQPLSWYGGIVLAAANIFYVLMLLYYSKNKNLN